jgi:Tfp pilus assembly protein PilO
VHLGNVGPCKEEEEKVLKDFTVSAFKQVKRSELRQKRVRMERDGDQIFLFLKSQTESATASKDTWRNSSMGCN